MLILDSLFEFNYLTKIYNIYAQFSNNKNRRDH